MFLFFSSVCSSTMSLPPCVNLDGASVETREAIMKAEKAAESAREAAKQAKEAAKIARSSFCSFSFDLF